jgi:hypothetical protein
MDGIGIIGPPPRPDMLHQIQRDQQERQRLWDSVEVRADNNTTETYCPNCDEIGYDAQGGYCPRCGYSGVNGYDVAAHRAASPNLNGLRCGHCGNPWGPDCCWYGHTAHERAQR